MITHRKPIQYGVDPAVYHSTKQKRGDADFVMSKSELVAFAKNPQKWVMGHRDEQTDAMDWGSLIDCLVLTPELFDARYAITPETYTDEKMNVKPWNWNANYCKTWREQEKVDGRQCVKPNVASEAQLAKSRLQRDKHVDRIMHGAKTQAFVSATYVDDDTGIEVPLQGLIDIVPNGERTYGNCLADLKTCDDASVRAWERTVLNYTYHVQAALYLDMFEATTGEKREGFAHVIQESSPPYAVARRILSEDFVSIGRDTYRAALRLYCRCLAENRWPGYDDESGNGGVIIDGFRIVTPPAFLYKTNDL